MKETLITGLVAMGLTPPEEGIQQLIRYGELLLEQNKVMNLTAITDPIQVARLHFLDSAALLKAADFSGRRVIDVGTGGGFPGLPLRILEPSLQLTLLDSLDKRVSWLAEVCRQLGLEQVECLHARAEAQALKEGFRESYDLAVSRAVASLPTLCELCLPYVKVGGYFLAMKSVESDEELSRAAAGIRLLGGTPCPSVDYLIPGTEIRHRIIPIRKDTPTPKGYPRKWNKMAKVPL